MALDRLTKITGPGIATDHNWVGNNATFTGVTTTGSSFNVGVTTIHSTLIEAHNIKSTGIITATGAHFSGNVSIAGTLTYEDVTNIDSVGIITAPALDVDDFLDVGSNIKLGNAGVITATSFVGSGANLTSLPAQATIANNADNRVITGGSGVNLNGESTLTFDTTNGLVCDSGTVRCNNGFSSDVDLILNADANNNGTGSIIFKESGSEKVRINSSGRLGLGTNNPDTTLTVQSGGDAQMSLKNSSGTTKAYVGTAGAFGSAGTDDLRIRSDSSNIVFGFSGAERLRIDSTGRVLIGTTTEGYVSADDLTVATTGNTGITIRSGTGSLGTIAYSDGTSGDAEYRGYLQYAHNGDFLKIGTAGAEKVRITTEGDVNVLTGHLQAQDLKLGLAADRFPIIQRAVASSGSQSLSITGGSGYSDHTGSAHTPTDAKQGALISLKAGNPTSDTFGGGIQYYANGHTSPNNPGTGNQHVFYTRSGVDTYAERLRIDSNGVSGTVKNNFLQTEFQRHDTSSQYGPLSTSFATDNNISATISNYQRGQRIIIRATVPCGIALQNGSGANYAGTSARIKVTNGSASTYSNDRAIWYRADGNGTHETTQNLFICLYINESNTDFSNGNTLTVTIEGKKNSGTGTSTHYIGGWSSVKEITVERYEKSL